MGTGNMQQKKGWWVGVGLQENVCVCVKERDEEKDIEVIDERKENVYKMCII